MAVTVFLPEEQRTLTANVGDNLLAALQAAGVAVTAPCGGNGTCGKCRVRLDGREVLACQVTLEKDCTIELSSSEDGFVILEEFDTALPPIPSREGYSLAVDVGTTTVVMALVSHSVGKIAATTSFLNPQRVFGADVISRIARSEEGALSAQSACIRDSLLAGMNRLCDNKGIRPDVLRDIVIAGNTTMIYLLLGYHCVSLGRAPFLPEFPHKPIYSCAEVLGVNLPCRVRIVPWVSAFVGGDITAGLVSCTGRETVPFLLMDIGTNGELALFTGKSLLCTATAAGPAFEGGNIGWGVGGIPGAIDSVGWEGETLAVTTIGDAPPLGICGSGVLDAAACAVTGELVDETGRLEEDDQFKHGIFLAHTGDGKAITLTQKDIRELQLAKSAIRSGCEILLKESGLTSADLQAVYLSGGFGRHLNLSSALTIGLLVPGFGEITKPIGNSSLAGCSMICLQPNLMDKAVELAAMAQEFNLSEHPDFQNLFMDNILFE